MSTPIRAQGNIPIAQGILFQCPPERKAIIKKVIINNSVSNYNVSISRVIQQPNPVLIGDVATQLYFKTLDQGDTVTDDNGYELNAGDSIQGFSNKPYTTFVITGEYEQA